VRIVGGKHRGRALAPVGKGDAAAHLRPTTDRVRESLFNLIEHGHRSLEGARVLDLFAGTGALGLEAFSRGAERVLFVEEGTAARALIRKNIEILSAGGATRLVKRDATTLGPLKREPFDIAFADPPYGQGLGEKALASALSGGWLTPDALIILEEGTEVALPAGIKLLDHRRYGDTVIHIGVVTDDT